MLTFKVMRIGMTRVVFVLTYPEKKFYKKNIDLLTVHDF